MEGCSWFQFNNVRLAPGMVLEFHTSVPKGLMLKARKFLGLILVFPEVKSEKLVEGDLLLPPMLNRVKDIELHGLIQFCHLTETFSQISFHLHWNQPCLWKSISLLKYLYIIFKLSINKKNCNWHYWAFFLGHRKASFWNRNKQR